MKKLVFPLILLALLLSACGAAKTSTPAQNSNDPAARTLPPLTQVAIGIFKLEGTDQAVNAKQAADLLPLWEVYSTLSQSETAAQAEIDGLVQQIQEGMTSDQMKAIQDMKLTQKDVFTVMQEKGILASVPQGSGTRTPSNNGSGFTQGFPGGRPEGGFQPGGGIPGENIPRSGTQTAGGQNRIPAPRLRPHPHRAARRFNQTPEGSSSLLSADQNAGHSPLSEIGILMTEGKMTTKTIMVVDDENRLVSLVESYLTREGYHVVTAGNGREALNVAQREKPDLIILDVMMPEMDGYEFMREHRAEHDTPIILLTARVEDDEKVIGLELGADDYVTKPFRPRELTARVRAVLRRSGHTEPNGQILRAAGLTLDRETRRLDVNGRSVDLTPSEFDLLAGLMSSPGRVFSRLDLLDIIQGVRYEGYERTIDTHIKNLRGKIEDDPRSPRFIDTVYGVGYRFARE